MVIGVRHDVESLHIGAALLAQDYDFDSASNVIEHTKGGTTTTYDYDEIDQLIEESRSGYLANYTYDNNGNRKCPG